MFGSDESASARKLVLALSLCLSIACKTKTGTGISDEAKLSPSGEPDHYSAVVVRIVEDGASTVTSTSREARLGDKRREEWTEEGKSRAIIWRPDLGKSYVLDLDAHVYTEAELTAGSSVSTGGAPNQIVTPAADLTIQEVDRYFGDDQRPERSEVRTLSSVVIDGHQCDVSEFSSTFSDGRTEIVTRSQAQDLSGLVLRVEVRSKNSSVRVITERREINTDVSSDLFELPRDFRKR